MSFIPLVLRKKKPVTDTSLKVHRCRGQTDGDEPFRIARQATMFQVETRESVTRKRIVTAGISESASSIIKDTATKEATAILSHSERRTTPTTKIR